MRFGIMAMQMGLLVPPEQPAEQVLANITAFDHADLVSKLAGAGFNPIELGGDLSLFLPHTFSPAAIEKLLELKAKGITYTVHLPLWSVEPSTPLRPVRRASALAQPAIEREPARPVDERDQQQRAPQDVILDGNVGQCRV